MNILKLLFSVIKKTFKVLLIPLSLFIILFECVIDLISDGDITDIVVYLILLSFVSSIVLTIIYTYQLLLKRQCFKTHFGKIYGIILLTIIVHFLLLAFLMVCPIESIPSGFLVAFHFIRRITIVVYFNLLFVLIVSLVTLMFVKISYYIQSYLNR